MLTFPKSYKNTRTKKADTLLGICFLLPSLCWYHPRLPWQGEPCGGMGGKIGQFHNGSRPFGNRKMEKKGKDSSESAIFWAKASR